MENNKKQLWWRPAFEDNESVPKLIKKYWPQNKTFLDYLCFFIVCFISVLIGAICVAATWQGLSTTGFFRESCPAPFGRTCNNRGECVDGRCVCYNILYSGEGCADNLIPGYDTESNTECNGNGVAISAIKVPNVCNSTFETGGWLNPACGEYVSGVRAQIDAAGGDLSRVPLSFTIPNCLCSIEGYSGQACTASNCPVNNEGKVCSKNGNDSVSFSSNHTDAGNGCSCMRPFSFRFPQYQELFSPEYLLLLFRTQNDAYKSVYCGTVARVRDNNGEFIPDVILAYSLPSDYKCFCNQFWKGVACNEGRCPFDRQTGAICNGKGDPGKGQGLVLNTRYSSLNNVECDLICQDGYIPCDGKCVYDQDGGLALFDEGVLCGAPYQCPKRTPLRCYDGSCAEIPAPRSGKCVSNFRYGTFDFARLDVAVELYKCPNLTSAETVTGCFRNTSYQPLITGYSDAGGVYFVTNQTLQINLTSPLVYFELVTNVSNLVITNWDGQAISFSSAGYLSHYFEFTESGRWSESFVYTLDVTLVEDQTYKLSPMPWNYSSIVAFNESFTLIRVTQGNQVFTLTASLSNVVLASFSLTSPYTGVLVRANVNVDAEPLFFFPNGSVVLYTECLAQPAACSWYKNSDNSQVRNLESTKFLCVSAGAPIVQDTACGTAFSSFYVGILDSLQNWYTELEAISDITIPVSVKSFESYQINQTYRTEWPFTLFWYPGNETESISLHDIVFLQQNQLTVPCACAPDSVIANKTVVNEEWWGEESLREVSGDAVSTGDYVLTATYIYGERTFVRAKIVAIDDVAQTLTVHEVNDDTLFDVYMVNARRITEAEVLEGFEDADLHFFPFHCPDGSATRAESVIRDIPGLCNCTGILPVLDCSCNDTVSARWGCEVNLTVPVVWCGEPANKEFEDYLMNSLLEMTTLTCSCLLYTPSQSDLTNNTFTVDINANTKNLTYGLNQVLTNLYVYIDSPDCEYADFNITASSFLFSSLAYEVNYTSYFSSCYHFLTLFVPETLAVTSINITSNMTMYNAIMVFSSSGYSISEMEQPTIQVSSNSESGYVINEGGGACWESDGNELPVYARYDFTHRYYVNYTTVEFCTVGRMIGDEIIPATIYLMASNGDGYWYALGSFGLFTNTTVTRTLTLNNSDSAYSSYMLYSRNGPFGISRWQLYSTSACECQNGAIMIANITDTEGLISVQDNIDDIAFWRDHFNFNASCNAVDECIIMNTDLSNNGVCEDAIYTGFILGIANTTVVTSTLVTDLQNENTTLLISDEFVNITYNFFQFSEDVVNGFDVVQFAVTEAEYYSEAELEDLYEQYTIAGPIVTNTSNTSVYYLYGGTNIIVIYLPITEPFNFTWTRDSFNLTFNNTVFGYDLLVEEGSACPAGNDVSDCGSSARTLLEMPGYGCSLTSSQAAIENAVQNTSISFNRTYFVANMSSITQAWSVTYLDIPVVRKSTFIELQNCPEQVCTSEAPFKCQDGSCALSKKSCDLRYNCPGNGCVEQTDVGFIGTFRCLCAPGAGGSACQFTEARPGTPFAPVSRRTPGGMEYTSGGPPPLRLKPPILDILLDNLTPGKVEQLNMQTRGSCAPRSPEDIGFHCVLPTHATWGQVLMVKYTIDAPNLTPAQRTFYSDCQGARIGFNGEYITLPDDVYSENLQTGAKVWRNYTDPETGLNVTFPWRGIMTYIQAPYRCPECSQCVPDATYCEQECAKHPIAPGGIPLVDGSYECAPGLQTFVISEEFSQSIRYPYAVINGVPDQSVWELNWNWKYYGMVQCAAADCRLDTCKAPRACFPGTPELNFRDRMVMCAPETGRGERCAPSVADCVAGLNLEVPLVCGGKGIVRQKDYTGQEYCVCGTPISKQLQLSGVSQITQLQSNGFGGIYCDQFFADTTAPLIWSKIDPQTGERYFSLVTRQPLPGELFKGNVIVGMNPDNKDINEQCCSTFERLELCTTWPCRISGVITCIDPGECLAQSGELLVDVCNGHGTATADGKCRCDVGDGFGYEPDYDQFSYDGCYKYFQCPISEISGRPCNVFEQCGQPEEIRYPGINAAFFEQQWATCNARVGPLTNVTRDSLVARAKDLSEQNIIASLSNIARQVELANQRLAGCVDIWPNDTDTERCCMIENDFSYVHNKSFSIPYMLPGYVLDHPMLTDGTVQAFPLEDTSTLFTLGNTIRFVLTDPQNYSAAAVRLFGVGNATLTFTSGLDQICPTTSIATTGSFLTWNPGGSATSAIDCSSQYTCKLAKEFSGYTEFCAVKPTSEVCVAFKEQACLALSDTVYWPPGSLDSFQGCERAQDPEGCVCCTRLVERPQITTDFLDIFVASGSIRLGQVRVYGFGDRVQPVPTLFRDFLDSESTPSDCQDEAFMNDYAGGIHEFFAPAQQVVSREVAAGLCEQNGGYLATTDDTSNTSNVRNMVRACKEIGVDATCWVDALDIKTNATVVNITVIINETCVMYGCSGPAGLSSTGTTPFSFNASSVTQYLTPVFTGQEFTSEGLRLLTLPGITTIDGAIPRDAVPLDIDVVVYLTNRPGKNNKICKSQISTYLTIGGYHTTRNDRSYLRFGVPYGVMEIMSFALISSFKTASDYRDCIPLDISFFRPAFGIKMAATIARYRSGLCSGASRGDGLDASFSIASAIATGAFVRGYVLTENAEAATTFLGWDNKYMANIKCLAFFPSDIYDIPLMRLTDRTTKITTGTVGLDRVYGTNTAFYMPGFVDLVDAGILTPFGGRTPGNGQVYRTASQGVYFKQGFYTSGKEVLNAIFIWENIKSCASCQLLSYQVDPEWDRKYYLDQEWPVNIDTRVPMPINIALKTATTVSGVQNPQRMQSMNNYLVKGRAAEIFTHQTVFIQTKSLMPSPPFVNWDLPNCLVVNPSGLVASTCTNTTHNFICNRDWPKYAIPAGLMGDQCGSSIRLSGFPTPLKTCFEEVPLANSTLFPIEHEIFDFYQIDALDQYIRIYNLQPSDAALVYSPVILGVSGAYLAWISGFSNRAGYLSPNQVAEENWCSMSIEVLYPVTCPRVYSPITNLPVRRCATSNDYCDPLVEIPVPSAMNNISRPPLLNPVSVPLSFSDPTCGATVFLSKYAIADQEGGSQSSLYTETSILQLDPAFVQFQSLGTEASWFNAGKSTTQFKAQIDYTITIAGRYFLSPCAGCTTPVLRVMLYPLNEAYELDETEILFEDVAMEIGTETTFQVEYTVTLADTGTVVIGDFTLPALVYQGVGFRVTGITEGAGVKLYNPVITDNVTRAECTTRDPPVWYNPPLAIESPNPDNVCVSSVRDQLFFIGKKNGECACSLPLAGSACDFPAITGPNGKLVCAGFGDEGKAVRGSDGKIYVTGSGLNAGGYVMDDKTTDCKTIDLARVAYTTLVEGSIWEKPYVAISALPVAGQSIYTNLDNTAGSYRSYDSIDASCTTAGMFIPWYVSSDELEQLISVNIDQLPVFLGVDTAVATTATWPWVETDTYFIRNDSGVFSSNVGTCVPDDTCEIVNVGNFAFQAEVDDPANECLVDGDTNTACTPVAGTITWSGDSSVSILVYIFGSTTGASVGCATSGFCDFIDSAGPNSYYTCNCPSRRIEVGSGTYDEVQIFDQDNLMRSTSYRYYI